MEKIEISTPEPESVAGSSKFSSISGIRFVVVE